MARMRRMAYWGFAATRGDVLLVPTVCGARLDTLVFQIHARSCKVRVFDGIGEGETRPYTGYLPLQSLQTAPARVLKHGVLRDRDLGTAHSLPLAPDGEPDPLSKCFRS